MAFARRADTDRPQPTRGRRREGRDHARAAPRIAGWPPLHLTPVAPGPTRAGDYAEFIETYCRVVKDSIGGSVGTVIRLRPWQRQLLDDLLAERADGRFRHRTAYIGVPRKNGKSAILSSVALASLFLGKPGGEIYSVAGDTPQARITFSTGRRMVEMDPELRAVTKLYRDAIEVTDSGSVWRVVSSEAPLKEGLSPTLTLIDEVHVIDQALWDVFALAMGARPEPLMVGITTAGVRTDTNGQDSLAFRLYEHGLRVASGELYDPSFYFAWWGAPENADHRSKAVWKAANPGFGDIVSEADFESAANGRTPEPEFRTKRLNQWVNTYTAWLPTGVFEDRAVSDRVIAAAEPIALGFDGSFSNDSTALVGCTLDGHLEVMGHWERPEDDPHWRVDMAEVEERIREVCRTYTVLEVAADPYRWAENLQRLAGEGIPVVEFAMGSPARMVPACAAVYDAIVAGKLTHSGDARLERHFRNARVKIDRLGPRVVKDTSASARKIDLAVAAIAAYIRAMHHAVTPPEPEVLIAWG
jgi:phage terminase large subunit-like protein